MTKQLSKKDIKEIVVGALEPFAKAVQNDFVKVNKRFDKVDSRLDKVDSRFDKVDSHFDKVDSRLDKVEFELNEVKKDVREMKENSNALYSKLDRFISLYEKHEQELAFFGVQLRRFEERLEKLEKRA